MRRKLGKAQRPSGEQRSNVSSLTLLAGTVGSFLQKIPSKVSDFLANRVLFVLKPRAFELAFEDDLAKWQPDIVQCHDWQTLATGAALKKQRGTTFLYDCHELETHRNPPMPAYRRLWMERYERHCLSHCDHVSTVCESIAKYLETIYALEHPSVVMNAPVADCNAAPPRFERWGRLPDDAGIRREFQPEDFVMVIVGNATVNRGIETTLEAMLQLPSEVKLAILGRATKAFRLTIDEQVDSLGLSNRVRFLPAVNPGVIPEFIKTADIGLIPLIPMTLSYELALPNKLFECAFAHLPIVASDTYEVRKMISRFRLGSTFEAGDPEALAAAVSPYYRDWKQSGSLRQDNAEFIEAFSFEVMSRALFQKIGV